MIGIYKIVNVINGKIYIGQSKDISKRWTAHRCRPFNPNDKQYDSSFYRAIRKYGINNFNFEVIEQCSIDELDEKERYWIKYYESDNDKYGYNLTLGGQKNVVTASKLNSENVSQIIKLLQNTKISQQEISEQFNISQREISSINQGQAWIQEVLIYPLRTPIGQKDSICPRCGKKMSPNAKICLECSLKERRKNWPTREELKYLIRIKTFTAIGKQMGVSDTMVKKWCIAYDLPSHKRDIKKYTDEEWAKL